MPLGGDEGRHAADVRRLRAGEPIVLTDGRGRAAAGEVATVTRGALVVAVTQVVEEPAPSPRFVVAQALARGGRDEDAVEAMTEVGVDEVLGWQAARCVARWTDRTGPKWTSVAAAAAKQSRRTWWPLVIGPVDTGALADRVRSAGLAVVLHEEAAEPLAELELPAAGEVLLVVGPEGGVAPDELEALQAAGARVARLGKTVLRSSTAGVAALSVLSAATRWR